MNFLAAFKALLESLKKYLSTDALKKFVISYAVKAVGISSSLGSWAVTLILKKLYDYGVMAAKKEITKEVVAIDNKKDEVDYAKVINDPKSTAEDFKNAAPDFLGGTVITKPK